MKKNSGFTLIELMVVVSIIAILSAVGFTVFNNARRDAADGTMKAQVQQIAQANEKYRLDNTTTDTYTASTTSLATYLTSGAWPANVRTTAYTVNVNPAPNAGTSFCVSSPLLYDNTKGNCTSCVAGAMVTGTTVRFCVTNQL